MENNRDKISSAVGQRIHDFHVRQKMSQESPAFAAGLHPTYLESVERGEKCPSVETIYKISKGLKIPISALLDLDSETAPTQTEVLQRIALAMTDLSDEEAVRVAEVVEKMLSIKENS